MEEPSDEKTSPPPPSDSEVLSYSSAQTESGNQWVRAYIAQNNFEASLAVSKLQAAGIRARVDSEHVSNLGAWAGSRPVGTSVQVLGEDLPAARSILEAVEQSRAKRTASETATCPACGSNSGRRRASDLRFAGFVLLVLAVVVSTVFRIHLVIGSMLGVLSMVLFFCPLLPRWKCEKCGNKWKAAVENPQPIEEEESDA